NVCEIDKQLDGASVVEVAVPQLRHGQVVVGAVGQRQQYVRKLRNLTVRASKNRDDRLLNRESYERVVRGQHAAGSILVEETRPEFLSPTVAALLASVSAPMDSAAGTV